ncbi:MAG: PQQ-binding-like beta-propeller repeat protein [Proteobacteria bacterium]|nr:PQQ-binding-like beta-propeller repeat protein [Pseudomonadota bacterium]
MTKPFACVVTIGFVLAACHQTGGTARAIDQNAAINAAADGSASAGPLTLAGSTEFPGYAGDFDHFAIDAKGGRLFLAGEESAELEVLDLKTGGVIKRLKGYGTPHSVFYMPGANELLVIDGDKPSPVLDAETLAVKRTYDLPKGADSIGFDSKTGHLWIVTGGKDVPQKDSNLIEIDPATGKLIKTVHFDADHVEAMAVEQNGPDLYINVTDKNYLAVVDKASGKVVKTWPIKEAEQNAPIAIDEKGRRLFVVTRKPGKLLVLDADTGATVAAFTAPERTDEVTWDAANRRVYVTGGQGYTSVVEQDDPNTYREVAKVKTLPGAKTAVVDSAQSRLWIAASPGETKAMGKVLWYSIAPR